MTPGDDVIEKVREVFMAAIDQAKAKAAHRYTVGQQPCQNLRRGDADVEALGVGNGMNVHQCPKCKGNRTWCENCCTDHHDDGWETCRPGFYAEAIED